MASFLSFWGPRILMSTHTHERHENRMQGREETIRGTVGRRLRGEMGTVKIQDILKECVYIIANTISNEYTLIRILGQRSLMLN